MKFYLNSVYLLPSPCNDAMMITKLGKTGDHHIVSDTGIYLQTLHWNRLRDTEIDLDTLE